MRFKGEMSAEDKVLRINPGVFLVLQIMRYRNRPRKIGAVA